MLTKRGINRATVGCCSVADLPERKLNRENFTTLTEISSLFDTLGEKIHSPHSKEFITACRLLKEKIQNFNPVDTPEGVFLDASKKFISLFEKFGSSKVLQFCLPTFLAVVRESVSYALTYEIPQTRIVFRRGREALDKFSKLNNESDIERFFPELTSLSSEEFVAALTSRRESNVELFDVTQLSAQRILIGRALCVRRIWRDALSCLYDDIGFEKLNVQIYDSFSSPPPLSVIDEIVSQQQEWMNHGKCGTGAIIPREVLLSLCEDKDVRTHIIRFSIDDASAGYLVLQPDPKRLDQTFMERIQKLSSSDSEKIRSDGLPGGWYYIATSPVDRSKGSIVQRFEEAFCPLYPYMITIARDICHSYGAEAIYAACKQDNPVLPHLETAGFTHSGVVVESRVVGRIEVIATLVDIPEVLVRECQYLGEKRKRNNL